MLKSRSYKQITLIALLALTALVACAFAFVPHAKADSSERADGEGDTSLEISSTSELPGKKVGMLNGGIFDQLLTNNLDGVSQDDIMYFNSNAETAGALITGKIDAMITDLPIVLLAVNKQNGIGIVPGYIVEDHYAYVLPKNSALTAKFNERLAAYKQDGTIERLKEKWTSADESAKTMPAQGWDAPNGTLVVATSIDNDPINYMAGDRACGMCIELLELIAKDLGYSVEYQNTNTGSLIAEIQSNKADVAAYSFSITEERKNLPRAQLELGNRPARLRLPGNDVVAHHVLRAAVFGAAHLVQPAACRRGADNAPPAAHSAQA